MNPEGSMKARIKNWLGRKGRTRQSAPAAYFTVLFDPEGRLMVCEGGVWKVFELNGGGGLRTVTEGRLGQQA